VGTEKRQKTIIPGGQKLASKSFSNKTHLFLLFYLLLCSKLE